MAATEQVQLMANKVRYKKRDGTLYLMGERVAWCPEGRDHFDLTVVYSDIKCQKVSPEGKPKIQLQIILLKGDSYVFHFSHDDPAIARSTRERVKNLLAQMLPKFRRKIDKELEEKNRLLQTDQDLFQTYKDLVVSGIITAEEFWNSHSSKLPSEVGSMQKVGVSAAFLADLRPQTDGCNGLRYNLTADTIQSIFSTYPAVKRKYMDKVPDKLSEKEFWEMFFQSHYFHRDRLNQGNSSKDIFSDCIKKDDQDLLALLQIGVKDSFNDLTYLEDEDSTKAEGYGTQADVSSKGKPSSTQLINKNIIKRFNHQSAMVLSSSNKLNDQSSGDNGTVVDGGPTTKKAKLKESVQYDDLETGNSQNEVSLNLHRSERYSHGPTIVNQVHQELNGQRVHEGMHIVSNQCRTYIPRLSHVIDPSQASTALTDLSPDNTRNHLGESQPNAIQHLLSPAQQEGLKQLYLSATELARHFWSCFPATTPFLQEKVTRMCKSIENFHQTRVRAYQDDLRRNMVHANVTEHLEDMFSAIFTKFNSWQSKKGGRK
uniref:General transcription factor IIH subunit 1-like n=1 Tax=Phallusia mammillata TaxID=59560 RepID=A0A6F9DED5_9ASCI|nr:general transcription factor IIH subunit 1-like [Phallusia mammillata]